MGGFCKCGRALAGTKLDLCHACYNQKWRKEHPGHRGIQRRNNPRRKGKPGKHKTPPSTTACKLLKEHHESMKDDPERLTTEFIKKLIKVDCKEI